jgi:hypothetical protein
MRVDCLSTMRMRTHWVVDEVDAAEVMEQLGDEAEEAAMKFQCKIACTDKTKQLKVTMMTCST